ncbi:hypothetical protein, partial [Methanosarcina sp. 2.H.T.1A.3]|uniref:hypothetical protein n=1 Tax=Methanosarcina sp. 2.H.T.1A.3 TaxID=1483597 RepID=UPI0013916DC8
MNKKIIYFTCFLLLLSPQLVFCEEGNNSTEEQTEDLIEYILGEYNHLFEIVGFVHTHECHELCNLSGSNVALGIWESSENNTIDAQVDDSRSELAGRIHIMDNYPCLLYTSDAAD